ncbi:MAG: outer membrane protein [Planctomycetota bacterium]|jgi:outer membrane protein
MRKTVLASLLVLLCSTAGAKEKLPALELGAGLISLTIPDYRGSSRSSSYLVPAPYIKYRGERFFIDGGAKGILFDRDDLLLTVSGNFTLPADSDTPEREGMEELDAIIEIGPSLNYRFINLANSTWSIDLPLRMAFTIEGNPDHIGQVFQPRITWRKSITRLEQWNLRFNFGPVYSSAAYHQYFYSVDADQALPSRPAFDADGGYSGLRTEFSFSRHFGKIWLGGFLRFDDLNHSVIDESPLVSEPESWLGGFGLSWVFHQK